MDDEYFFDYITASECRKCSSPCRYTRPRDPAYARIAVCCSSLNLLSAALFRAWTVDVEAGLPSPQITRWLVEIAKVSAPASMTLTHLFKCAIQNMNVDVLLELQRETQSIRHTSQIPLASALLHAMHVGLHQGMCVSRVRRVVELFIEIMRPPERVMHGLVLNVLAFACCVDDPTEHLSMLETVLGSTPRDWWVTLDGGIACALRWARLPSHLIGAFQERGIVSLALPSWEFEELFVGSAACHHAVQSTHPFVTNRCVENSGLSVPSAPAPFHLYAILYGRISVLNFTEVARCAELLHGNNGALADAEQQRAAAVLLDTLFLHVKSLEMAETVLSHIGQLFPPALRRYLPPPERLGIDQPVIIQLALVRMGVSAEGALFCMSLTGPSFVEIRLKMALTLALAGADIEPPVATFNRWLVEVASNGVPDAVQRFISLCDYGSEASPFPNCPRFAEMALRSLLLYNMGVPDRRLPGLMDRLRFGRAAALARLWTRPFSIYSFHEYPVTCRTAVMAFLLAARRTQRPWVPVEILLRVLESAAGPLHLGRCRGPWEPGEAFPLTSVELNVHDLGQHVVGQRSRAA